MSPTVSIGRRNSYSLRSIRNLYLVKAISSPTFVPSLIVARYISGRVLINLILGRFIFGYGFFGRLILVTTFKLTIDISIRL